MNMVIVVLANSIHEHESVRGKAPVLAAVANITKETYRFSITSDWFLGRMRPWKSKYVKDDLRLSPLGTNLDGEMTTKV